MGRIAAEKDDEQLQDEALIARILAGEQRLYEHIMRRYNARMYRIGMSIVNNDTEVEDMMQVTYIKAYEHLRSFEGRSGFGTWLTRIMINESLHHLKKSKRDMNTTHDEKHMNDVAGHTGNAEQALLNKELSKVLEDALVQLPEKYRMVFMLREVENLSVAETVDTLQITEANVKVRLNRAKTMLRDTLSGYYKNNGIYHFHLERCDRVVNKVLSRLGIGIS